MELVASPWRSTFPLPPLSRTPAPCVVRSSLAWTVEAITARVATPLLVTGIAAVATRRRERGITRSACAARAPVQKGQVLPAQLVPESIQAPPYVADPEKVRGWWNAQIVPKSEEEIEAMRAAGKLAHSALDLAEELIRPGLTTEEMDKELHTFICDHGAYPSDLQYKGFPKSVMISINEVICHGIPDTRPLEDGDLVNVDVTLYLGGFHADTARSWMCGQGDETGQRLVSATREALDAAVAVCAAGTPLKAIGTAVATVAEREKFGIVKTLVGHGIGEFFHGVPQIFHCRNSDNRKMQEGTTFTIEPVLTEGSAEWITWDDGWTVATEDAGRAAQFEHTVLITAEGCEVLT
ncbi:unnamed protein product [Durusdinium trenchii]|uniref:Methionine aminopeptidase n=1 Tax=Durusdinium trenchii TaxID=1381693 RepID=A0ABP0PES6_9DINO